MTWRQSTSDLAAFGEANVISSHQSCFPTRQGLHAMTEVCDESLCSSQSAEANGILEPEPRLKYARFGSDEDNDSTQSQPLSSPCSRLVVSDKLLAVGHQNGAVTLLDTCLGTQVGARLGSTCRVMLVPLLQSDGDVPLHILMLQVRVFREHSREITDLGFDDSSDYLASASSDGTVAVSMLGAASFWHSGSRSCINNVTAMFLVNGQRIIATMVGAPAYTALAAGVRPL
jgi:WD40 repeat protein